MMATSKAFDNILSARTEKGGQALNVLVEQLNADKDKTIYDFLSNPGCEDVLWALFAMLSSENTRMASNAAYILGSLAETEDGSSRILSILSIKGKKSLNVLENLTRMLEVEDAETVMNAAGTLGTMAETEEGRSWMLNQSCIQEMLTNTTFLLGSESHWTASNSALVLARMTISESGRQVILDHPRTKYILQRLIQSLGNDSAGRGMNAAFAVGRLLDTKVGKDRLLNGSDSEKMITSLCRMLSKGDMGGAKNACFAISCLATDSQGNQGVLTNNLFQDALNRLVLLLSNTEDNEACWFSAMTLKTISSHKNGVIRLRQNSDVEASLLKVHSRTQKSKELEEEVETTLKNLKKLNQPDPPYVEVLGSNSLKVIWNRVTASSGFQVTYRIMCDNKIVYKGQDLQHILDGLVPFTSYCIKLRASTMGDDSPYSETVTVSTDEDVPTQPTFLRVVGSTPTQLRLTWNAPECHNGILRNYYIYLGDKLLEATMDTLYIISRLSPATHYTIHVCAATSKGMGEKATVETSTEELGAHAPEKPTVTVIGRNEMQVSWMPPSVPLGRFFRYELCMNDRVVYQGIDKFYRATGLTPDTEYIFVVIAITSEGRCASDPTKKRTPKDKSQHEPGHHQLKTHSFMAKEFQAMQEKSKTMTNLMPPIQKPRNKLKKRNSNLNRPSSNISLSNASDTSALTDGTWAISVNDATGPHNGGENDEDAYADNKLKPKKKFQNAAVIGGAPIKRMQPALSSVGVTHLAKQVLTSNDGKPTEPSAVTETQNHGYEAISSAKAISDKLTEVSFKGQSLDKENKRQTKFSSTARNRARLHRSQAIMKGKKVLKSDKELLAEMSNRASNQETPMLKQRKLPETSYGQRPLPYYPDIVSAIRKQYGTEGTIENDLQKGKVQQENNSDSPDSLNPEPGTARQDIDAVYEFSTETLIKRGITHESYIKDHQLREYAKSRPLVHSSSQAVQAPKLVAKSSNHVIVKPAANSKYGLKYNVQRLISNGSTSSTEADSAFHSFSHVQEITEGKAPQAHKSAMLEPITSDTRLRTLSDRNLNADTLNQVRAISSRMKTPAKGYWSDHDISPARPKKKAAVLNPINYRTFQSAHRPTKSIRLESPMLSNPENGAWQVGESVYPGDNNRYNFVPTQWRTQPANLPLQPKPGKVHYRLETLHDRGKKLDMAEKSSRSSNHTLDSQGQIPQSQKYQTRKSNSGHNSKSEENEKYPYNANQPILLNTQYNGKLAIADDITTSVHKLKTGSLLAALNYQNGYNAVTSHDLHPTSQLSYTNNGQSIGLPKATATTIPHTILSPLSPSDQSSNSGSLSNPSTQSPKSAHLRLTSSSSTAFQSSIATATGYAITPTHSVSPLSGDSHVSRMRRHIVLVPGGGDPV